MSNTNTEYWIEAVKNCIKSYSTPFYLFSTHQINNAINKLDILNSIVPIKHWYSLKTQPVSNTLRYWKQKGFGVEVVSEYEFRAAMHEKFSVTDVLINGIAKSNWLQKIDLKDLKVHIDSMFEFNSLVKKIKENRWQIGLRFNVNEEFDPDDNLYKTQFGLSKCEMADILRKAKSELIRVMGIHFHLRSNITNVNSYKRAIYEVIELCKSLNFNPFYVDIGGGLPSSGERPILSDSINYKFQVKELLSIINKLVKEVPSIKEVWMENGRFITAKSGVLVVKVLDIKEKVDSRYLICDSGRTNNAFVSDWEDHDYFFIPERQGKKIHTTVCGPTCMAYDRFFRKNLTTEISIGDYFIWMNAGAYHKSWETRFSNGLIKILWKSENNEIKQIRKKESFHHWWNN